MAQNELEKVLARVSQGRRAFLRTMLIGSAVAAIPVVTSRAIAAGAEGEEPNADGTCNDGLVVAKKGKNAGKCVAKKKKKGAD
jgi:hypothetical protein